MRYGVAVASTLVAALLRWLLDPVFQDASPHVIFFLAIIPSAVLGGWGPGLTAVFIGAVASTYLFVEPRGQLRADEAGAVVLLLLFVVLGIMLSGLGGAMQRIRRRAQEQADRLTRTLENMAEGFLVLDRDWRVLRVNRRAALLLRKRRDELLGHELWKSFPGARELRFGRDGQLAMDQQFAVHYEEYYPPLDLWLEVDTYPAGGELSVFLRDITERKRAERVLRESEGRFRGTFENAAVAISHTDIHGHLLRHNQKFCEILGYTREELKDRCFSDFTYPPDIASDADRYAQLWNGQIHTYNVQKRYVHKDGHILWVEAHRAMQRDSSGRPSYSINIVQDITVRKQAEEALEDAKRTAEQARLSAEEASRAKDRFLATLSHELRTPITPVLAAVSLLQRNDMLDGRTRRDIEMIRRNIELEARLIDDLLDLTRIVRGKVELDKRQIDLTAVVHRAIDVCRSEIEARKLDLRVNMGEPLRVEADAARLQQVFWNLLKNAIKFTPQGGTVTVRCGPADNGHAVVEVSDNGPGIEVEELSRIFEAFEQGRSSVTRGYGGLGLGLAISKSLVEMHGGTIDAHSGGAGLGARFYVRLPLAAPVPSLPATPPAENDGDISPRSGQSLLLLVVEDHADTAEMMQRMLESEGHEVVVAGSVAAALDAAGRRPFDMLISDLGLPDGSGLDLMRTIRTGNPSLPGIALSGYGQDQDIRQSREAGFIAHLVKPVDVDRLFDAIDQIRRSIPSQTH